MCVCVCVSCVPLVCLPALQLMGRFFDLSAAADVSSGWLKRAGSFGNIPLSQAMLRPTRSRGDQMHFESCFVRYFPPTMTGFFANWMRSLRFVGTVGPRSPCPWAWRWVSWSSWCLGACIPRRWAGGKGARAQNQNSLSEFSGLCDLSGAQNVWTAGQPTRRSGVVGPLKQFIFIWIPLKCYSKRSTFGRTLRSTEGRFQELRNLRSEVP